MGVNDVRGVWEQQVEPKSIIGSPVKGRGVALKGNQSNTARYKYSKHHFSQSEQQQTIKSKRGFKSNELRMFFEEL